MWDQGQYWIVLTYLCPAVQQHIPGYLVSTVSFQPKCQGQDESFYLLTKEGQGASVKSNIHFAYLSGGLNAVICEVVTILPGAQGMLKNGDVVDCYQ